MRADLHVHSLHSEARYYRRVGLRDSYSRPVEVYEAAKTAGMDFVTLTDLDTIEGCLRFLDERGDPGDFIVGEEVEAGLPGSTLRIHLNVWGISEEQHREIARLKEDVRELAAYLRSASIACCFNHFVGVLPVSLPSAITYWEVLSLFSALEVRNGSQGRHYNDLIAALAVGEAASRGKIAFIGGSDAHTLRRVGTTWTEAPGSTREEFLEAIRQGRTAAGGRVRRQADVALDIASLIRSHYAGLWNGAAPGGRAGGGEWARAVAMIPVQVLGAPLVGTAVYFIRVRAQVRALQQEIATLDLREFRKKMRAYPRPEIDAS